MKALQMRSFISVVLLSFTVGSCSHAPKTGLQPVEYCRAPSSTGGTYTCGLVFDPQSRVTTQTVPAATQARTQTLSSDEMRSAYEQLQKKEFWQSWIHNESDYLIFFHHRSLVRAKETGVHPSELWDSSDFKTLNHYRAYRKAQDYVNSIPQGSLKLSPELFAQVNKMVGQHMDFLNNDKRIGRLMPDSLSRILYRILPNGFVDDEFGAIRRRLSYGNDPIFNPLNEEQYQALKSNPWISGFVELPLGLSGPGRRRGLIMYSKASDIERKLGELVAWYESNVGRIDPVELAAKFQYRYVSIHPHMDGNGRTSMILLNRILRENGLPPMARTEPGMDLYMTEDQWVDVVRDGMARWIDVATEMKTDDIPSVYDVNFKDGPRTRLIPETRGTERARRVLGRMDRAISRRLGFLSKDLMPAESEAEIAFAGVPHILAMDGFFYNNRGIPHAAVQDESGRVRLYPIPDRTYFLYGENGRLSPRRFSKRQLTESHRDVFRGHFSLMRKIQSGEINPRDVEIAPYETIREANNKGQIHLYPWQEALFENAIKIRDTDPMAVLSHTRGYQTTFEQAFELGHKVRYGEIIAQFQLMDLKFREYDDYARAELAKVNDEDRRKKVQSWIYDIQDSRLKMWRAARTLIRQIESEFQKLSPADQNRIAKEPYFKLHRDYLRLTALDKDSFTEFMEAQSRMRNEIVLLRADNYLPRYVGFRSNQEYLDLARKLPGFDSFRQWVIEFSTELKNANTPQERAQVKDMPLTRTLETLVPGFRGLIPKVARVLEAHRYNSRGLEEEFDRIFVDHALHAVNGPLKQGLSFSTAPSIYIRSSKDENGNEVGAIPFQFEGMNMSVYFVSVPRADVSVNVASKYFRQYEVLAMNPVSARRIEGSVGSDYFQIPTEPMSDEAKRFWEESTYLRSTVTSPDVGEPEPRPRRRAPRPRRESAEAAE